jgi:hypothetical protein
MIPLFVGWISLIESKAMIKYLIYKHTIINMKEMRFPSIASNSIKSHLRLERVA